MPSPLGHGLVGLAVHALTARDARALWDVRRALVVSGAAVAPDLDLLFRYVDGRNHHQAETHSIGAAILAGLAVAAIARLAGRARAAALGLVAFAGWLSHPLLDYFGNDTHPPIGLMALWPLDRGFYKSPFIVFMDIGRTLDWETVRHNTVAVSWELLVLTPFLAAAWWLARRRVHGPGL
ncbi:MAG TPA: metal-dependent hydrolase [Vicinamibacteria bacterium]|nr:metal-dependent hydrolase [Vicinamibacteria bacterium]